MALTVFGIKDQTTKADSIMLKKAVYSVIDLFAGPGGLGEGFASLRYPTDPNRLAFKTAISIEKDPWAHRTLRLRHFYSEFRPESVPEEYYRYLGGDISLDELYSCYPEQAKRSQHTAWLCTLGEEPPEKVKTRIREALNGEQKWVLVGGPPCQAYSLIGRSRMSGNPDFEYDPRHLL
jgi:DNA (cytosine-5)-methyltransferase 1